ncbi:type II toxin-antitoxin system PemK/MazF family toxin [Shinella pollutisoli]|uniref:Type II toxin-antitoxin system PemK/MazF family toxin n=1 Tax=Shinella pollutisoli TaxID=2250594 RepID=A0ABV7DCW7_9HYPH
MKRGDLVTVAVPGDFGKPRPALVVQSDLFADAPTVTLLLLSSTLRDAPRLRIDVAPDAANGLRLPSQVMVDKVVTVRRERIGAALGRLDEETLAAVTRAMALFLGLAETAQGRAS